MAQIAYDEVGSTWVDASTLGTFTQGDTYFIQNRGLGTLLAVEGASEPTTEAGVIVDGLKVLKWTVGTDKLWLKSNSKSYVNITSEA